MVHQSGCTFSFGSFCEDFYYFTCYGGKQVNRYTVVNSTFLEGFFFKFLKNLILPPVITIRGLKPPKITYFMSPLIYYPTEYPIIVILYKEVVQGCV